MFSLTDSLMYFLVFAGALGLALVLTPVAGRLALKYGQVDQPDQRKVHTRVIPRSGGIAIVVAFLVVALLFAPMTRQMVALLLGVLVIFITGLLDDTRGLTSKQKLVGIIAGALVTMLGGQLWVTDLGPLFGAAHLELPLVVAIPFTLLAVVGVVNAINLMDGLDALAGGLSLIAALAFAGLALVDSNAAVGVICLGLAGGLIGFLRSNKYPARIFMGDCGSLTLGFVLAFIAIMLTQTPGATVSPVLPVLILGIPIFDTLWVMTARLLRGKNFLSPDMTHLHHKMLSLGIDHPRVVMLIHGLAIFWSGVALIFHWMPDSFLLLGQLAFLLLTYLWLHSHRGRRGLLIYSLYVKYDQKETGNR